MSRQGQRAPERTSALEWAVALLGALVIASTIAFLIHHAITQPTTPPDVAVAETARTRTSTGFLVEFTAVNNGNATAANLTITGTLSDGNRVLERSEVTLDYLPQQASRTGGLFFATDPAGHDLVLAAGGYAAP